MTYHVSVMLKECVSGLNVRQDGIYFDGTLGGGGHSEAILSAGGRVIATDRDREAIAYASERLEPFRGRFTLVHGDFKDVSATLKTAGVDELDGAILDLGISSHQIDTPERGFSYMQEGILDMRMNADEGLTAADIVNTYKESELVKILFAYGEEKFARRIAAAIVKQRAERPIETTRELSELIAASVPKSGKGGHPAKRTFQALRVETNSELQGLGEAAETLARRLKSGGRMCVLTFQSLEDRIIKQTFGAMAAGCVCDKSLPMCVCGHREEIRLIAKMKPSDREISENPRSASATLRIIEKR